MLAVRIAKFWILRDRWQIHTCTIFIDRGEPVQPGGIGSIGYCMGGRHVLCVAGAYPDRFIAGASLHGTADGTGLRVGMACAEFNGGITLRLLDGALDALAGAGTDRRDVTVAWAPGAFELPLVARAYAHAGKVDAVLCLGGVQASLAQTF